MLRSTILNRARFYSTKIPFDPKPFPFHRFEPCCPDMEAKASPNGYVPCKSHPIPNALGKKIDFQEPMTGRPEGLRHIVGCVGYDAPEWTKAHCDSIPGIMQSLDKTQQQWLETNTPDGNYGRQVMVTVAEREPTIQNKPDVMVFPEFKMIPSVDISHELIEKGSSLYHVMDKIWKNPRQPLSNTVEWQDVEADTVVFVCTHGRRDMRCGYLGPPIVDEFNKQAKEMGLKLEAWGTCHFGGKNYKLDHFIRHSNSCRAQVCW